MNSNSGHLSCIGVGLALLPIRDQSGLAWIGLVALDWKKVEHFTYGKISMKRKGRKIWKQPTGFQIQSALHHNFVSTLCHYDACLPNPMI